MLSIKITRDTVAQRRLVRTGEVVAIKDHAEARRLVVLGAAMWEPAGPAPSQPAPAPAADDAQSPTGPRKRGR